MNIKGVQTHSLGFDGDNRLRKCGGHFTFLHGSNLSLVVGWCVGTPMVGWCVGTPMGKPLRISHLQQ